MICEHSGCTGMHDLSASVAELCPAARGRANTRHRDRYQNDPEHRASENARTRAYAIQNSESRREYYARWYASTQKRPKYVYAVLVNASILKIGCSTMKYERQEGEVRHKCRKQGFPDPQSAQMIWHTLGDEGLEIFLQWVAGRTWSPLVKAHTRHTEWFDVTGVTEDEIRASLSLWLDLCRDLEKQLATPELTNA